MKDQVTSIGQPLRLVDGKFMRGVAMTRAAELAEQEVEERMRAKAIEALDQTIRAVLFIDEKDLARYKDIFIQKLTEQ